MARRFVAIFFPYLLTDWFCLRTESIQQVPFVLTRQERGRVIIHAANELALQEGIETGMSLADARAIYSTLKDLPDKPGLHDTLLQRIAEWSIRYSPIVGVQSPDGIILESSGCAHLWGGEENYLTDILKRITGFKYKVKVAMADTMLAAWAAARFGKNNFVIPQCKQADLLRPFPIDAFGLEPELTHHLYKLGLSRMHFLFDMPARAIRRRFGETVLHKIDLILGNAIEEIAPVHPPVPYEERLVCLENILTHGGIATAIRILLEKLCDALKKQQSGLRKASLKCFRIDGKIQTVSIGTLHPSNNEEHISRLFELKIEMIEPAAGIELFLLEAVIVEKMSVLQNSFWNDEAKTNNAEVYEMLDRITSKIGEGQIHRFIPDEHHWPERSVKQTISLSETSVQEWNQTTPRPFHLLATPVRIEVTAPIPDYPPMLFKYNGKLHKVIKADGPERIEQEWWLQQGDHRDYYLIEDEAGARYWLFREGHYAPDQSFQWFLHGFFA